MIIDPQSRLAPSRRKPIDAAVETAAATEKKIRVQFGHGLGDNCYFSHLLPLYIRRGYQVEVNCHPSMRILYEVAGAKVIEDGGDVHLWTYPRETIAAELGETWQGSKVAHGISQKPLPNIGTPAELFDEFSQSRIDVRPHLSNTHRDTVRAWLANLPKPITLLHSKGTTASARKSLPDPTVSRFYAEFLDQCNGTLILLDWDDRVPMLNNYRIRHLSEFGVCTLELLLALYCEADLMIGVDSGPLHLTRFTDIPTVGVWRMGHYPQTYSLPRAEQVNFVLDGHTRQWNRYHRVPFQIIEQQGIEFEPRALAELAKRMLTTSRYLRIGGARQTPLTERVTTIAQDVFLQHLVRDLTKCGGSTPIASHWDRQRSIDVLLGVAGRRFRDPTIVETGTIRAEEDFHGAGFFTYIASQFVATHGGRLFSVDLSPENVQFSKHWTAQFGRPLMRSAGHVKINEGDSVRFLTDFKLPIDVLYLDSLDADAPGHEEHCLAELQAAMPMLRDGSLICVDDTPWSSGHWIGKGAQAVPWLLDRGWKILYAGYQVVLERSR